MKKLDPRIHAYRADLADERLVHQVEAERYIPGDEAHVHRDSVPLFSQPTFDGELQTEALFGEAVRIFEIRDGWAWGQILTDDYVGYLPLEGLSPGQLKPTHYVSKLRTFIYEEANLKSPPIALISMMSPVAVIGQEGEFSELADKGYVYSSHLSSVLSFDDDFVAVAERFVGTPYLWGGRTSLGLDCSALIQIALQATGEFSRRDSDLQAASLGDLLADSSDISQLKRGDLVFWKGHIGLMINEADLLHSNAHHMAVEIEPLAPAVDRIRNNGGGEITAVRRFGDYKF
ncbi:MAG: C40 family peptidase [Rhizobiales bacterium]|nr:C40 family peptidase [Hyphomicrobiales bacterium]